MAFRNVLGSYFQRFGLNKKKLKKILKKSHELLERSVSIPIFVNDTKKN